MSNGYLGEIRMFGGNFAPVGWRLCDGSILPISENEELFNLIGTTYGGDGQITFAVPDLRGRLPIHQGNGSILGEIGGAEQITLTVPQIPAHGHPFLASGSLADQSSPAGNVLAQSSVALQYFPTAPSQPLAPTTMQPTGGTQPHSNVQPYLCVTFIIALSGVYPPLS